MRKTGTTPAGAVIVEMTAPEFAFCEQALSTSGAEKRLTHGECVAFARKPLRKMNPKTKAAAVHSIEAMFQFHGGVTTDEAERIVASLQKEKVLTIDELGRIKFPDP